MSSFGNFSQVQEGKEPNTGTQHDNMNWNQQTSIAKKEHEINCTATTITTTFSTTTNAGKEDNADSTATSTTTVATSIAGSEWEDSITEGLTEITTSDELIYVFGKRRRVKPARKWRTSTDQEYKERK